MCYSPIIIPNPSYRKYKLLTDLPSDGYYSRDLYLTNVTTRFISVPCGHCADCLRKKQNQLVQRSLVQSTTDHIIMLTLTYNKTFLPTLKLQYSSPDGVKDAKIHFADVRDVQNMFKRIRKYGLLNIDGERPFKYLLTSEFGGKKHRPHFHLLLFLRKLPSDLDSRGRVRAGFPEYLENEVFKVIRANWVRNIGTNRKPIYRELCDYVKKGSKQSWQCEYVRPKSKFSIYDTKQYSDNSEIDVSYYVTKYSLKFDSYNNYLWAFLDSIYHNIVTDDVSFYHGDDLYSILKNGRVPFQTYWQLIRAKVLSSKFFGLSCDDHFNYISNCIKKSIDNNNYFANFINPVNGKVSGLSAYYMHKCLKVNDYLQLISNTPDNLRDNDYDTYRYTDISKYSSFISQVSNFDNSISKFNNMRERLKNRNNDDFIAPEFDNLSEQVENFDSSNFIPFTPNYDFDSEEPLFEYVPPKPKNIRDDFYFEPRLFQSNFIDFTLIH